MDKNIDDFKCVYGVLYFNHLGSPMMVTEFFQDIEGAEKRAKRHTAEKQIPMYVVKVQAVARFSPSVIVERAV
jgi:hypothetical protein